MESPPLKDGVCLKFTPEVGKYLSQLDDTRLFFVKWKITTAKDLLSNNETADIRVLLSKQLAVTFHCVGMLDAEPGCDFEIVVLTYEESITKEKLHLKKILTAVVPVVLIAMELLYYGSHNVSLLAAAFTKLSQWLSF